MRRALRFGVQPTKRLAEMIERGLSVRFARNERRRGFFGELESRSQAPLEQSLLEERSKHPDRKRGLKAKTVDRLVIGDRQVFQDLSQRPLPCRFGFLAHRPLGIRHDLLERLVTDISARCGCSGHGVRPLPDGREREWFTSYRAGGGEKQPFVPAPKMSRATKKSEPTKTKRAGVAPGPI